ncbi:hypothetical protein GGS23DRAFT_550085 [Durotheca rogersii]|uniref:uncharacterized protein n=1 Tax=Durotheca rogersii TaxID=419775 RepID=UPI00221E46E4|nr:uncharacterized protein GGS23DRAFT_550085 [Durotheca rogersii]KAI5867807.1 hypothetical protein GGS23DRAFT_550085 [Durotheca rogersii]
MPPPLYSSDRRPYPARVDEDDVRGLAQYRCQGGVVRKGTLVEIARRPRGNGQFLGFADFLHVALVYRHEDGRIMLCGVPFARTRHTEGLLPFKRNEVYAILESTEDDDRAIEVQAAIKVPADDIIKIRAFQITNATYPEHRCREEQDAENRGVLTQRWKIITSYKNEEDRRHGKISSRQIVRVREDEAQESLRIPSEALINRWRGGRARGGSYIGGQLRQTAIILDDENRLEETEEEGRGGLTYSFADSK